LRSCGAPCYGHSFPTRRSSDLLRAVKKTPKTAVGNPSKTKVAVIGASGYVGEELVRLLLRHPHAELAAVTSRQFAGKRLAEVFPDRKSTRLNSSHRTISYAVFC